MPRYKSQNNFFNGTFCYIKFCHSNLLESSRSKYECWLTAFFLLKFDNLTHLSQLCAPETEKTSMLSIKGDIRVRGKSLNNLAFLHFRRATSWQALLLMPTCLASLLSLNVTRTKHFPSLLPLLLYLLSEIQEIFLTKLEAEISEFQEVKHERSTIKQGHESQSA